MRRSILFLLCGVLCATVVAQSNERLELEGSRPYPQQLSDIWGWTSPTGEEYALLGTQIGFAVVDITDPGQTEQVVNIPGGQSIWRDIKTYENFAYVSDDQAAEGILIMDLSELPEKETHKFWFGSNGDLVQAHNLFIADGILYVIGHNLGNRGVILYDLKEDPWNPKEVGRYDLDYVHDIYVRGDTMWTAQVYSGVIGVVDISNKQVPELLTIFSTVGNFSHNCWLSDDGNTLFTSDEIENGFIASYDVADIDNVEFLDKYQASPGTTLIPHNCFVKGDLLYISFYRDGVIILDISDPSSMVEVGRYDTSPLPPSSGYDGCWGVYPYLPSGRIIASDVREGLFVFNDSEASAGVNLINNLPIQYNITTNSIQWPMAAETMLITDLQGKIVEKMPLMESQRALVVNGLADGVYVLTFVNDGIIVATKKIVRF